MVIKEYPTTVAGFEAFIQQPENVDKLFEYIGGEIVEVPSNTYVSNIAILIATFIQMYLLKNDIGHVTGEAGGYMVAGERYAPDVAFISYDRQPELTREGYNPNPPELAIEVVFNESRAENDKLTVKLSNYLSVGTIVWIVRPEAEYIEVHRPGQPVHIFRKGEKIDGGTLLPGFQLEVTSVLR